MLHLRAINIPSRRRPQVCLKGKVVDLGVAIEASPQLSTGSWILNKNRTSVGGHWMCSPITDLQSEACRSLEPQYHLWRGVYRTKFDSGSLLRAWILFKEVMKDAWASRTPSLHVWDSRLHDLEGSSSCKSSEKSNSHLWFHGGNTLDDLAFVRFDL